MKTEPPLDWKVFLERAHVLVHADLVPMVVCICIRFRDFPKLSSDLSQEAGDQLERLFGHRLVSEMATTEEAIVGCLKPKQVTGSPMFSVMCPLSKEDLKPTLTRLARLLTFPFEYQHREAVRWRGVVRVAVVPSIGSTTLQPIHEVQPTCKAESCFLLKRVLDNAQTAMVGNDELFVIE